MIEVRRTRIYDSWIKELRDQAARARINIRVRRLLLGNPGDVRPVGEGISELRINYGSGYRVYYRQRGDVLIQRAVPLETIKQIENHIGLELRDFLADQIEIVVHAEQRVWITERAQGTDNIRLCDPVGTFEFLGEILVEFGGT